MNGASHHHANGNGATMTAPRDPVLPRDPVAELMEQVANGRVRPMDAAAQVRREWLHCQAGCIPEQSSDVGCLQSIHLQSALGQHIRGSWRSPLLGQRG